MTPAKRKVSVSLDADLVAELEAGDETLSAQVNEAIRAEVAKQRRHRLLRDMLDTMEQEDGPLDEDRVREAMDLLR